jgi:histidinol-phosphate/aromatic aminotransferase/cobyric acid decarboxylase-like protein
MIVTTSRIPAASSVSPGRSMRMDLLSNPYAPVPEVRDAGRGHEEIGLADDRLESMLVARISRYHGIPPESIVIAGGISCLLAVLVEQLGPRIPLLVFPPTDETIESLAEDSDCELIHVPRDPAFQVRSAGIPGASSRDCAAYIMSPNDPTGTLLRLQEAVSIARAVSWLIIDERHSAYSLRDHLPLQREFDNVVLARTLETWGGLTEYPLSYAIANPELVRRCRHAAHGSVDTCSLLAGIRSFDHSRYLDAAVRQVSRERADLIRALRKLNMLRPLPSAANFVLARLERGDRDHLREHLERAGITVYYPSQPGLEQAIRISAISATVTRALSDALVEWARCL